MKVNATSRSKKGSSASRRLRHAGRVPAIIYGGTAEAQSVELDHNEIFHSLRKEAFHASILDLHLDGSRQKVLLRAVQWHPYKPQVMHVDFQRILASEPITTRVPLHFLNGEESPAVKLNQQVITHVLTELEISCLPADLPSSIVVDLGALEPGGNVYLGDITLPEGVTYAGADEHPVLAAALARRGAGAADEDDEAVEGDDEAAEGSAEE
ncbi:MAG: 50S ribosomal protein L25/general stress protein Ctc [Castellaniella sp.]